MLPLPRFTLVWPKEGCTLSVSDSLFPRSGGIGVENFHPAPVLVRDGTRTAVIIGSAILGERINPDGVARHLLDAPDLARAARDINGQFLAIIGDTAGRSLTLISDRHSGWPLYWADLGDRIVASFLYSDLARLLRQSGQMNLVHEHLFEFLWLQRHLRDKTHDSRSRLLAAATIFNASERGNSQTRYWRPDFTKNTTRSASAAGAQMAELLRRSMARRTSDGKRYGLFLSGGHDSRTVLAASPVPLDCYTVGYSDNYEVSCARRLAGIAGAPFHFLRLPPDHLHRVADSAARLCGGLYAIDHALFLGHHETVAQHSDVVFHGHGLDYMYQGMYLPARYVNILGRPTFFRRLTPLSGDVAEKFLNEVPYRLKHVDLMSMVRPEWRDRLRQHMRAAADAVIVDGEDVCANDADRWEYFLIHSLGRHFSWPNVGSKMVGVEQRTPSFDIDLFDFYLSLPPEQRVTAAALRNAQRQLNRELAMVPTGNWGIPAAYSPVAKTAWLISRKILRHMTGNHSLRAPHAEDRTWADRDVHLCSEPAWNGRVAEALADEELEAALPFLDWPLIRERAPHWMTKPSGGAAFLVELLTLRLFLKDAL